MTPAIVIPAFNRPAALERLLDTLKKAHLPSGVPLVLVIDRAGPERHRAGNAAVIELAQRWHWPHGPKEIVVQPRPLGLVGNVFYSGGLAEQYGAAVLLEDDLIVSARFYDYACGALAVYGDDSRLAGIALNTPWFNGFTHQPFIPLLDDGDTFFLQLSTPQGQVYTAAQWAAFRAWLAETEFLGRNSVSAPIHDLFTAFPADDWLHIKAHYLAAAGRYYVYPRESLTTNFGEPGTHFAGHTALFQVPLQERRARFRYQSFDEATAVYDGFFELRPDRLNLLTDRLSGLNYDIDLYAAKSARHLRADHVLTTRPARAPLAEFAKAMHPLEANIIAGVFGKGIALARREDVHLGKMATLAAQYDNSLYFARYRRPGRLQQLQAALAHRLYRLLERRDR
jgi:hypothetical protein